MDRHCSSCQKYGSDLKKCSRCKAAFYCSPGCQRDDWPRHKTDCKIQQPHQEDSSEPAGLVKQLCSNCKTYVESLKRCTGCQNTAYCSKSCQLEHWPKHKASCKSPLRDANKTPPTHFQHCANCDITSGEIRNCTGCRATAYCSKSCQKAHFPKHKANCKWSAQDVNGSQNVSQKCANCKIYDRDLKKCVGCGTTAYCSKVCQQAHWPSHKANCNWSSQDAKNPASVSQKCANCKSYDRDLKKCVGCGTTAYCSKVCQQAHWPSHKANCNWSSQDAKNPASVSQKCANCKSYDRDLKKCVGCGTTAYCSKVCQQAHWPSHKANCNWYSQDAKNPARVSQNCANCKIYDRDLKKCVGCGTTAYCSKVCQQAHWPKHKASCNWSSQNAKNPPRVSQKCANCKIYGKDLKKCAGCGTTAYCSKVCQQAHWPKHKEICNWSFQNASNSPTVTQQCANCKSYGRGLKKCFRCGITSYCSKVCQQAHWPKHKQACMCSREWEKTLKPREFDDSICRTEPGPSSNAGSEDYEFHFVRDHVTGSVMLDKQEPLPEFYLPPVPPPGPVELSRLVTLLKAWLSHPMFFDLLDGQRFTFTTDLRRVMPESYLSVLHQTLNTILVAKIVEMDICWARNGIRIMGNETKESVIVYFHMPGMNPFPFFKWSDAVPGNYICIRAPVFHTFMDGQVGFRINHASHVRILSASGELTFGM